MNTEQTHCSSRYMEGRYSNGPRDASVIVNSELHGALSSNKSRCRHPLEGGVASVLSVRGEIFMKWRYTDRSTSIKDDVPMTSRAKVHRLEMEGGSVGDDR